MTARNVGWHWAESLCWSARELKAAWLRSQHGDWTENQVAREVARIFANARSWTFPYCLFVR